MEGQIMKNKSASRSVAICLFIILASSVRSSPALANSTTWIGSSGDWFSAANWNNGVPTASTDASINNTGKAQINSSGATAQSLQPSGGQLTIAGGLTFSTTAAAMQCNVVPAGADNVSVSGTATLNGRLSVTMTGTFTPGTTYTLLHADNTVSGTFSSVSITYPPVPTYTPVITYDANNVHLYLRPN